MKTYVDGYVLPIAREKLPQYQEMAAEAGQIWIKHGALQYFECAGDDLAPDMSGAKIATFPEVMKTGPEETVIFAFVVFESREHRDAVNRKVMEEMTGEQQNPDCEMPFDLQRMVYGGFQSIVKLEK